jgi:ATP phosphoribosyltransferase
LPIKVALPKGRLLSKTARLLERAGWGMAGYQESARLYRVQSSTSPELSGKMFHEKDIPVQVSIGNYDLGICGQDWIEELLVKYPSSDLIKVRDLGYGDGALYAAAAQGTVVKLSDFTQAVGTVCLASEYPNLAESLAGKLRLRRFKVFPLWGAAEAHPPESADLVILPRRSENELTERGLMPLGKILDFRACLIANRKSLENKEMGTWLAALSAALPENSPALEKETGPAVLAGRLCLSWGEVGPDIVRLALPDGHQQAHVRRILDASGVKIDDYPSAVGNRRPKSSLDGVVIKVFRPQDMPSQVANSNFDLAITGKDWLRDHLYQFPSSPIVEMLDLHYGRVRIVAVVNRDVPAQDMAELQKLYEGTGRLLRVASEYVNIADKYVRSYRFGRYLVVPTWGATEAYLPEDADMLIENTETGSTIARHSLRIIDTLFESTACLIGRVGDTMSPIKQGRIAAIVAALRRGVEEMK